MQRPTTYKPWSSFLYPNGDADGPSVLAKLDAKGKLIWSKPFVAEIYYIKVDAAQNIYVSGTGRNIKLENGTILADGPFVVKLDKTGKTLWGVVCELFNQSNVPGPIALADDGIYWNATFYGITKLQGRSITAGKPGSPDAVVAKISGAGMVTGVYQDGNGSGLQYMVEAENGNAAFVVNRGGSSKSKIVLDKDCKVVSETTFPLYGDLPGSFTKNSAGEYETQTRVGVQTPTGYVDKGFYNIRFTPNLDIIDSTKIFEAYNSMAPAGVPLVVQGRGSQDVGYFLETMPKPFLINQYFDWLHLDKDYNITTIADENPANPIGDAPFSRRYVKMVGDTLNMVIRRFTHYYGNTFTLDKQTYTTRTADNFSWFWAKYVFKDPDECLKVKAQVLRHGKEGSQNAVIRLLLPTTCPATEDLTISPLLDDPSKNKNDFVLPSTVVIMKGQSMGEITVPVTDDLVMELNESFTVSFSLAANSGGYKLGSKSIRFNIEDDDTADELIR
jgi:hypothetical protein